MSDSENTPPTPPNKPVTKTSAVPLKKETVRITLRAKPGTGASRPKKATAPVPVAAPPAAAGEAPKPASAPVPAATPGAAPAPAGTAPVPAAPASSPTPGLGKTERVQPTPVESAPLTPALGGGGQTQGLPQATGKLQQTQRVTVKAPGTPSGPGTAVSSAPLKAALSESQRHNFDEAKDPDAGMMPLAIVCAVLAAFVLGMQLMSSDIVGIGVTKQNNPSWERKGADGQYKSTFSSVLPEIPE